MKWSHYSLLSAMLALASVILLPFISYAQPAPVNLDSNGFQTQTKTTYCLDTPPSGSGISAADWDQKYTGRFIYCMRIILEDATKAFLKKMINEFAIPTLGVVLLFAMAIFGFKLLGGMFRNAKAEGFAFLIKMGVIVGILSASDLIVDFWFDTTDMLIKLVADGSSGLFGSTSSCPMHSATIGSWFAVWDRFDCLFGQFVGFGKQVVSARGILAIISAAIFTGSFGIWLAFIAFGALYMLAQFLFRSAMMVLLSYGGLGLMIMVLPLYLPLILFKATENFLFQSWIGFAVGFVIQPALTIVFLIFALTVMDDLMINGSKNTYIKYDQSTHTTDVRIIPPGGTVPAGYSSASEPWHKTLGIDLNSSEAEQRTAVKRFIAPGERIGGAQTMESDPANFGYLDHMNCGIYGFHNLSTDTILKEVNKQLNSWDLCTDKQKCKNAASGNLSNAPSEATKIRMKMALCDQGRNAQLATAQAGPGGTKMDMSLRANQLNLNYQNSPDGTVAYGTLPSQNNLADSRMMKIIGSMGTIIVMAGTFLSFVKTIPGLVNHLTGGPSPKMSLASPTVMGHKLSERLKAGLRRAQGEWSKSAKKDMKGDIVKTLANRAGLSAARAFVGGFISGRATG